MMSKKTIGRQIAWGFHRNDKGSYEAKAMPDEKLEQILRQSLDSEIRDEEIKVNVSRDRAERERKTNEELIKIRPIVRPVLVSVLCVLVAGVGIYILPNWQRSKRENTQEYLAGERDNSDSPELKASSLVEIEDQSEQFKKMEKELSDLKTIKVKLLPKKQIRKFSKIIYENYFQNKNSEEDWTETDYGSPGAEKMVYDLTYGRDRDGVFEYMEYGDNFVRYTGELFGEDYFYETTEEQVIQRETKKLFGLLGLAYGDKENGYVIDKTIVDGNNSVQVHLKRYIEGKETSIAWEKRGGDLGYQLEDIELTFGNNQIIEIDLNNLTELVDIQNCEKEVLVDTPQKARGLVDNYIREPGDYMISENGSIQKIPDSVIETARISYVTDKEEGGIFTLSPMAEFYEGTGKVYQTNLMTEEVWDTGWCSLTQYEPIE